MKQDIHFLNQCLKLAYQGKGRCAPNPAVGAVVVQRHTVVGQGFHAKAGQPHAEVHALGEAGTHTQHATLYVTLEPCCHQGRTPPCTQAIIDAGIQRVVYAYRDPNPVVRDQGAAALRAAGIAVDRLAVDDIEQFYRSYDHWHATRTPWITAKLALSQDNKTAGENGVPAAITGPASAHFTHQQRLYSDAILTTAVTVNNDDPQLNVRLQHRVIKKLVCVLDRHLRLKADRQLFHTAESITLFHQAHLSAQQVRHKQRLKTQGVQCVALPLDSRTEYLDLNALWNYLGQAGKHDVWVEAGSHLFYALIKESHTHQAYVYQSNQRLGSTALSAKQALGTLLKQRHHTVQPLDQNETLLSFQ